MYILCWGFTRVIGVWHVYRGKQLVNWKCWLLPSSWSVSSQLTRNWSVSPSLHNTHTRKAANNKTPGISNHENTERQHYTHQSQQKNTHTLHVDAYRTPCTHLDKEAFSRLHVDDRKSTWEYKHEQVWFSRNTVHNRTPSIIEKKYGQTRHEAFFWTDSKLIIGLVSSLFLPVTLMLSHVKNRSALILFLYTPKQISGLFAKERQKLVNCIQVGRLAG